MSDPYTTPEPAASALITIDLQNDFTLEGAPAMIAGTAAIVPAVRKSLEAFRKAGRPIIHVVRLYKADGSNVDLCRRHLIQRGAVIARPATEGAELVDALKPDDAIQLDADTLLAGRLQSIGPNEWILYKPRWSAFHDTMLKAVLDDLDVTTLAFAGCNFPNCPRASIYDASNRDYRLCVIADAMSELYERGLAELQGIGVHILTSDDVETWLRSS
ncbi:Tat (Twin-arginine translocation) pathway signal sequence [Candidatus Filomicrobium marinum]|uniref:Tat (Twin-arginine translocation) pathway signal sequence n=2 Tax=Filomicrobium TaxID=119044 RepID=A0A0D6JH13_9HYPH|nr:MULTISPECIES: cysteine hydrolase [Filomicrobium]MCV0369630.1 cysteine hydrolase [Filomicrobium sp.]CFX46634.1 Tat (Twin-arginine translocation) pathway signal sequence [Candidatus Filomicrobium marinum]CPR20632.1 Tat (Twin-arginine translocation) pathway signal sequence [Candidatus Filomicrobium marinum]SDP16932.1 Nicotinamidase-related amidase [Filomicrobium insigne]